MRLSRGYRPRRRVALSSGAQPTADLRPRRLRRHLRRRDRRAFRRSGWARRSSSSARTQHLGGLSSGGLGFTDTGNKAVIGGLSREFYHRVWRALSTPEAWKWQKREEYGNKGQGTPAIDGDAADDVDLRAARRGAGLRGSRRASIRSRCIATSGSTAPRACKKDGAGSRRSRCSAAGRYAGRMFIDATYEGDLMAAAGVDYHVGREAQAYVRREVERRADRRAAPPPPLRRAEEADQPYVVPGDPTSGVLPRISTAPPGEYGAGRQADPGVLLPLCA